MYDNMSWGRISIYVVFGILLPVIALTANYYISISAGNDFDMLYTIGAMFLLPRLAYLYVTIGSGIVALLLWLFFFRTQGKRCGGFIGGILLFNALFDGVFGIAGVYRLLIIPVWLPPFCAAPVLFLSGIQAMKIARSVMPKRQVIATFLTGFLFVIVLSLLVVRQPWGLIRHLPNARGVNLSGMNLSHIYLEGASGVTFEEANMSHTDLSYACLVHCNLNMHKVNLYKANLTQSFLSVVNFTEADLRRVNLNDAKIYEVDFTGSDFQDASLGFYAQGRVIMRNTNLCGADLREIKNISGVYVWEGAIYNTATLWPKDFNPVEAGAVLSTEENTAK